MKGPLCTVNTAVTSYLSSPLPSPNVNRYRRQDERAPHQNNTNVVVERLEGV